jgi:hypothetical protein
MLFSPMNTAHLFEYPSIPLTLRLSNSLLLKHFHTPENAHTATCAKHTTCALFTKQGGMGAFSRNGN